MLAPLKPMPLIKLRFHPREITMISISGPCSPRVEFLYIARRRMAAFVAVLETRQMANKPGASESNSKIKTVTKIG